jgi:hypothetical protein
VFGGWQWELGSTSLAFKVLTVRSVKREEQVLACAGLETQFSNRTKQDFSYLEYPHL